MPPPAASEFGPAYDAAVLLLWLIATGYGESAVELPERQYVTPGIVPAYDEPQLTVSVQAIRVGIPGQQIAAPIVNCPPVRYITLRAELIRCTPTVTGQGAPPKAAELLASAGEVLRDLELVDRIVRESRTTLAGKGDPTHGVGIPVAMTGTSPVGPDGGLAGVRVDIDVPL